MKRYELIDHTADIGIRVFGETCAELFENAGYALFDIIAETKNVAAREKRTFQLERENIEELLVEWLNSLLFAFDTEQLLFAAFSVKTLDAGALVAEAAGDFYQNHVHVIKTAVKAITYHNLSILEKNGIWEATLVLDV